MKKILSILLAGLIIASSVHLTIATHYCGGNFEGYKVSVSGEKASCGMEQSSPACNEHRTIGHNCCTDKIATYLITDNFSSTAFHFIKVAQGSLVFLFGHTSFHSIIFPFTSMQIAHSPPGECLPNMVDLASFCIFRI
jgi:hypothetical protein